MRSVRSSSQRAVRKVTTQAAGEELGKRSRSSSTDFRDHILLSPDELTVNTRGNWNINDAVSHLCQADKQFLPLVNKYGIPPVYKNNNTHVAVPVDINRNGDFDPFHSLVKIVVYQQLAVNAANSIFKRFTNAVGMAENSFLSPSHILDCKFEVSIVDGKKKVLLNGNPSGLSESKWKYVQNITEAFLDESRLKNVDFESIGDCELKEKLTQVKGLGPWSVDMFLMFVLHRPNVLPIGDLGFRRGLCAFLSLPQNYFTPSNMKTIEDRCKHWAPYSSLASFYMWNLAGEVKPASKKTKKE